MGGRAAWRSRPQAPSVLATSLSRWMSAGSSVPTSNVWRTSASTCCLTVWPVPNTTSRLPRGDQAAAGVRTICQAGLPNCRWLPMRSGNSADITASDSPQQVLAHEILAGERRPGSSSGAARAVQARPQHPRSTLARGCAAAQPTTGAGPVAAAGGAPVVAGVAAGHRRTDAPPHAGAAQQYTAERGWPAGDRRARVRGADPGRRAKGGVHGGPRLDALGARRLGRGDADHG